MEETEAVAAAIAGGTHRNVGSRLTLPVPAAAEDALNIWYVNPLPNTPDWGRSGRIFQEGGEANGYKATMVGPNKIDIPAMISRDRTGDH